MNLPYEFHISLRYLLTKKRQKTLSLNTFISIAGITLGTAALIATLAVMTGFKEDLREKILGTNSHIVITDRLKDGIADYHHLLGQVKNTPHVIAATPFIYNQVLLSSDSNVHGVVLRGINTETEGLITDIKKNLFEGKLTDLDTDHPGENKVLIPSIIIGKELAMRLGIFTGDKINVISPVGETGPFGLIPRMKRFQVVGIFDSGFYEYDSSLAYISMKNAQEFFKMGDTVSGIEVRVDDYFRAGIIAREIENRIGFPYQARDWMRLNKNLFTALQLEKAVMFIILVLIILVASFNIIGILTMMVVEKKSEIAILKAMGATRKSIMAIFMLEGITIGVVGTLIGIPLGYGICELIPVIYTLPSDVYYISHIPVKVKGMDVLLVSLSAILISFGATLYPSLQAGKLKPVEALRYE
ncbi:MAG: lipoprotein-releasing ABC transporter permease subunit [Nitrospirae bacterium]|nr:lipoprotein-releasing ABC transporter permease subunit [Nitrospirota bacterium]MBI3352264.1 lipoprotein-releasing ABC transporter permease subunit [Nitrospirota bacterium]